MNTNKQEMIIKKKLEQFLTLNFPPYTQVNYLTISPDYNKVELFYNKDVMIVEIGVGDGSMYKLLSTNFR